MGRDELIQTAIIHGGWDLRITVNIWYQTGLCYLGARFGTHAEQMYGYQRTRCTEDSCPFLKYTVVGLVAEVI